MTERIKQAGVTGVETGPEAVMRFAWQITLFMGLVTLVLGIVVTLHPSSSLDVIAVLAGILLLISGAFQLIRALEPTTGHRVFSALVGLAFVVVGVLLIRHLDTTRVLIALLIGIMWIVQGIAELLVGLTQDTRQGRGWAVVFGLVSLIAGIVVVAWPVGSLVTLAVLIGIWFIIIGLLQVLGAFTMRHLMLHQQR